MYLSAYDFDISFLPGESTLMRQSDWLSREGCEPISDEKVKQSRYMNPMERAEREMKCDDCRSGSLDKATHHVTTTAESEGVRLPVPQSVDKPINYPTPKMLALDKHITAGDDPQIADALPSVDSDGNNPTIKIGGYRLPKDRIHNKLERYELTQFPRDKLENLQREDPYGKLIFLII